MVVGFVLLGGWGSVVWDFFGWAFFVCFDFVGFFFVFVRLIISCFFGFDVACLGVCWFFFFGGVVFGDFVWLVLLWAVPLF